MSTIIFFLSPLIFGAAFPSNIPVYFLCLAFFIVVSLSVGTAFGLFVRSSTKQTMYCQIIFLPSIMLSGIMFPAELLPTFIVYIGKIFPASWGFELLSGNTAFLTFLPLLIITAAMLVLIAIKFRLISKD